MIQSVNSLSTARIKIVEFIEYNVARVYLTDDSSDKEEDRHYLIVSITDRTVSKILNYNGYNISNFRRLFDIRRDEWISKLKSLEVSEFYCLVDIYKNIVYAVSTCPEIYVFGGLCNTIHNKSIVNKYRNKYKLVYMHDDITLIIEYNTRRDSYSVAVLVKADNVQTLEYCRQNIDAESLCLDDTVIDVINNKFDYSTYSSLLLYVDTNMYLIDVLNVMKMCDMKVITDSFGMITGVEGLSKDDSDVIAGSISGIKMPFASIKKSYIGYKYRTKSSIGSYTTMKTLYKYIQSREVDISVDCIKYLSNLSQ